MRGKDEDPVLGDDVRMRLAHLVSEQRPRRAQATTAEASDGLAPGLRAEPPDGPQFLPSDDEDLDDRDAVTAPGRVRAPAATADEEEGRKRDLITHLSVGAPRVFSRAHLGVVAALLVVGLVCAGWSVLRARPVAMANPVAVPSVATTPAAGGARRPPTARATPVAKILVHVLGAVREPGVVTVPATARVRDALEAAGGLTSAAAPGELNLAQQLADGQQIVIGTRRKPAGEVRAGPGTSVPGTSGPGASGPDARKSGGGADVVDLNSATQTQLEGLPGVGPVTAGKILDWRTEHGRFTRVEELQEVDGIGPKTYAQIAPHARV